MICWTVLLVLLAIFSFSEPTKLNGEEIRILARIGLGLFLFGSLALYLIG